VRQRGGRRFPIGKIQWHMRGRSYAIAIRGRKLQGGYPGVRRTQAGGTTPAPTPW
jgi:hypothetical protein